METAQQSANNSEFKPEAITTHCVRIPHFRPQLEADQLAAAVALFPWDGDRAADRAYVNFGRPYGAGGKINTEHPIPPILVPVIELVASLAHVPVNYPQCHRMTPNGIVLPHKDPAGMIVPMLTLGQERTFRVGGKMPQFCYRTRQSQRKLEHHLDYEEVVMRHGDLLIFTGGQVVHSMVAAKDDPNFNPNGFEFRYSLLFRWTTDAMREFGPGDAARKAGHDKQYREAIMKYGGA